MTVLVVVEVAVSVLSGAASVVVVVVLAGAAAEVDVSVAVTVDYEPYQPCSFPARGPLLGTLYSTYSGSTCGGRESSGSGLRCGIYLGAGGFGHNKSTADDILGILRERARFTDLRADRTLDSSSFFYTSATDGWCYGCLSGSLFGDIAGFEG